jgi:hypothetical protein
MSTGNGGKRMIVWRFITDTHRGAATNKLACLGSALCRLEQAKPAAE